jgi:hypothetical protein
LLSIVYKSCDKTVTAFRPARREENPWKRTQLKEEA